MDLVWIIMIPFYPVVLAGLWCLYAVYNTNCLDTCRTERGVHSSLLADDCGTMYSPSPIVPATYLTACKHGCADAGDYWGNLLGVAAPRGELPLFVPELDEGVRQCLADCTDTS